MISSHCGDLQPIKMLRINGRWIFSLKWDKTQDSRNIKEGGKAKQKGPKEVCMWELVKC